jgi:catechol 2,3-dioxygenase-like lactoylglutathione lyase family enzyme
MSANRIARRDALLVLGAATIPQARAASGLLHATRVDHVALAVGDIDKAMLFYRRLFGNDVLKNARTPRRYLRLGPCYLGIEPAAPGQAKRVDHAGIGIENFDQAAMKNSLEKAGLKVREGAGLFVNDPDGVTIQIWADQSWKLNNAAPEPGPKQEALFHPLGMHHLSIQVTDMARALDFYGKLFGDQAPGAGNPPQHTFIAGETRIVLYNPAPNKPARIDHFSVLVERFDPAAAVKALKELGARAELSRDGMLNEFFDPDGIRLQVTFPGQPTSGPPPKK